MIHHLQLTVTKRKFHLARPIIFLLFLFPFSSLERDLDLLMTVTTFFCISSIASERDCTNFMGSEAFVDSSMPSLEWFHLGYREEDLSRDLSCDSSLILFSEMKRMQRGHGKKVSGVLDSLVLFFPGVFFIFHFLLFLVGYHGSFFLCIILGFGFGSKGAFYTRRIKNLDILFGISPFFHRKSY